jgi:hypothetical protein
MSMKLGVLFHLLTFLHKLNLRKSDLLEQSWYKKSLYAQKVS